MIAPSALFPISLGYLDLSGVAVEVKKNYSRAILRAGCLVRQNDGKKNYELENTAKSAHSDDCLNGQPFFRSEPQQLHTCNGADRGTNARQRDSHYVSPVW